MAGSTADNMGRPKLDDIIRNTSKFLVGDGCWEWQAARDKDGYGLGKLRGKTTRAHRAMWILLGNAVPVYPQTLCHCCDNRRCVRPSHLFVGTNADNTHDMIAKGRSRCISGANHWVYRDPDKIRRGSKRPDAKLTEAAVLEMRKLHRDGCTYAELARIYKVHFVTASDAIKGKKWKHVGGEV